MVTMLNRLADRALARVLPSAEAAAGCTPSTTYQYKCTEHVKYRRQCVRNSMCYTTCYAWVSYSHC